MFQNFLFIVNLHYLGSIFFRHHGLRYADKKSNLLQFNSTFSIFNLFQVKGQFFSFHHGLRSCYTKFNLFKWNWNKIWSFLFHSNQFYLIQFNYLLYNFIFSLLYVSRLCKYLNYFRSNFLYPPWLRSLDIKLNTFQFHTHSHTLYQQRKIFVHRYKIFNFILVYFVLSFCKQKYVSKLCLYCQFALFWVNFFFITMVLGL